MSRKALSITLLIIILFSSIVYGNAGPTYWEGHPSLEALSIEEDSPIVVEREQLTFDFTRPELEKHIDYNKAGVVTASYEMLNPTVEKLKVQMAFPIISRTTDFKSKDTRIMVDDKDMPYEIYLGDTVDNVINRVDEDRYNDVDFDKIVKSISNANFTPQNFELDDIGKLYRFDIENRSDKGINPLIDFTYDKEKTKILSDGFNSFHTSEEGDTVIGSYIHRQESLELFVIGQDVDLNINVYEDVDKKEISDDYLLEEESMTISVEDYLMAYLDDYIENNTYSDLPYQQLLNIYLKNADEMFSKGNSNAYIWLDELTTFDYFDMVFVLVYELEFNPNETKNVSISYITESTMDRRNTVDPLHTYEYLINPAANWGGFKDLNIEIIPPDDSPYVIESSLELKRMEDGSYRGEFESLPEDDLIFTIYSKEEVTYMDKIVAFFNRTFYMLPIFILPIILIITIVIILLIIKRFRGNRN